MEDVAVECLFNSDEISVIGKIRPYNLPGTEGYTGRVRDTYRRARSNTQTLVNANIDGVMVENVSDMKSYELIAAMSITTREVRRVSPCPVGVSMSCNDVEEASVIIGQAVAAQASFVHIQNCFVPNSYRVQKDVLNSARRMAQYRKRVKADHLFVMVDTFFSGSYEENCELIQRLMEIGVNGLVLNEADVFRLRAVIHLIRSVSKDIVIVLGSDAVLENKNMQNEKDFSVHPQAVDTLREVQGVIIGTTGFIQHDETVPFFRK